MKQIGIFLILMISLSFSTDNQIKPDDYPVTKEMLEKSYKENVGSIFATSEIWFKNSKTNEVLIFGLSTDYFRTEMVDCKSDFFMSYFIKHFEYSGRRGTITDLTRDEKKFQTLKSFYDKSIELDKSYFKTNQGILLGIDKEEVISKYGKPHEETTLDNIVILKWDYKGFPGIPSSEIKEKIAINSFGYHIRMYFMNGKLVATRLQNDIP